MQNLIPLIIIGVFIYLIFSRKGGMGGMGCCGGHGGHDEHPPHKEKHTSRTPAARQHDDGVIDLREGSDYVLIPAKDEEQRTK